MFGSASAKAPMSPASSRNKDKKVVERKPVVAGHDDGKEEEVESGYVEGKKVVQLCLSEGY